MSCNFSTLYKSWFAPEAGGLFRFTCLFWSHCGCLVRRSHSHTILEGVRVKCCCFFPLPWRALWWQLEQACVCVCVFSHLLFIHARHTAALRDGFLPAGLPVCYKKEKKNHCRLLILLIFLIHIRTVKEWGVTIISKVLCVYEGCKCGKIMPFLKWTILFSTFMKYIYWLILQGRVFFGFISIITSLTSKLRWHSLSLSL